MIDRDIMIRIRNAVDNERIIMRFEDEWDEKMDDDFSDLTEIENDLAEFDYNLEFAKDEDDDYLGDIIAMHSLADFGDDFERGYN